MRSCLLHLDPGEDHAAVRITAVERLKRSRDLIDAVQRAQAQADVGRRLPVADCTDRGLGDGVEVAVTAAMSGNQFVGFEPLGASEEGPAVVRADGAWAAQRGKATDSEPQAVS